MHEATNYAFLNLTLITHKISESFS